MVREGPELKADGVVRWRCADLQRKIKDRLGVIMRKRTVGKQLAALGFRRVPSTPSSVGARDIQERFAATVGPTCRRRHVASLWFQDEARAGQQGTLTPTWADRGARPPARATRHPLQMGLYLRRRLRGPRATTAAPVMPRADTSAMNAHLADIAQAVAPGAHAVLVMTAGWHGSSALRIPDNITIETLPPYAPELNPVETSEPICGRTIVSSPYSTPTTTSSTDSAPHGTPLQMTPRINYDVRIRERGQCFGPSV
ncbi:transposase [Paracoccus beibuensis]|uniref:transposase n=1 Tax=Paracoccus beibuensis TaxID=547602 RepID=UPI002AD543A6|nr:transposase [Paracoccus beibuensis]